MAIVVDTGDIIIAVKKDAQAADGCTKHAKKGGVCVKHGAVIVMKTCNHDGCTKYVQKGGFCRGHYVET